MRVVKPQRRRDGGWVAEAAMRRVLIAGCGYVGQALAAVLRQQWGAELQLWGLRRSDGALPGGAQPLRADLGDRGLAAYLPAGPLDAVVFCAAAAARSEAAYQALYVDGSANLWAALRQRGSLPQRIVFISSTAVYAQDAGEAVDELSAAQADHFRGHLMRLAEAQLPGDVPRRTVVRLGGIYGPGRRRLLEQVAAGTVSWPTATRYTNRIHRDDAAGAVAHLLSLPAPLPLYLGVDNEAATQAEVLRHAHALLQRPLPAAAAVAPQGPACGRRCSNARLRASGYRLSYPSYRVGLAALV